MAGLDLILRSLGDGNAENERNFGSIFIETQDYRAVADNSKTLILGGRGTGKSAIFRMLGRNVRKETEDGFLNLAVELEADPFGWREFEKAADGAKGSVAELSRQWELAILLHCFEISMEMLPAAAKKKRLVRDLNAEVAKYLNRDLLKENPQGRMAMIFAAAVTILQRLPFKFKIDAPFVPISLETKDPKDVAPESSTRLEIERRGVVLIESMYGLLGTLLGSGTGVTILVDQLDEDWKGRTQQVAALCGLITAAMRVMQVTNGREQENLINFTIFLRDDIYEFLKQSGLNDATKYRRREVHLRWDKPSLFSVLERRVTSANVSEYQTLESVFTGETINRRPLVDHLLSTVTPRPRDAIQFFAECLETCVFRSGLKISRDDVRSAEAAYSGWRRDVILEESRVGYDYMRPLLESFNARTASFAQKDLTKHLNDAKSDYDISATKPRLEEALVDFGILGVRSGRKSIQYIWDVPPGQRPKPDQSDIAAGSDCWIIHPSLHRVLDIHRPASPKDTNR